MADLLELSSRIIDEGLTDVRPNRVTTELSEIGEGLAVVEAFSHIVALDSGDGLVLFDATSENMAERCRRSLRSWSDERVAAIVYTHGHLDHVGGGRCFLDEAAERGDPRPRIVGHENVAPRFERYAYTRGYNRTINARQFGARDIGVVMAGSWEAPDTTFHDRMGLAVGDSRIELRHALGETDDHAWGWIPDRRAVLAGDFLTWVFPNAGNPQKVQRFPVEWAAALREMAALEPELFLPAHGLPIAGTTRIATVLDDVATALESLVTQTVTMMNAGARLDEIIHTVAPPAHLMDKPYLPPVYDEPEFVVRNIWRLYGGWYDGNPARLKPPPDAAVAAEMANLAGGAQRFADRARELSAAGDHRLACHLAEMAAQAAPDDPAVHEARAAVYDARRQIEGSLMSRGIFRWAASESQKVVDDAGQG